MDMSFGDYSNFRNELHLGHKTDTPLTLTLFHSNWTFSPVLTNMELSFNSFLTEAVII